MLPSRTRRRVALPPETSRETQFKGAVRIDHQGERSGGGRNPGLYLLFERGQRPDLDELQSSIADHNAVSLSHSDIGLPEGHSGVDGVANAEAAGRAGTGSANDAFRENRVHWAELLRDGLTFDLAGLQPGPAMPSVEFGQNIGIAPGTSSLSYSALTLWPGPHLAGAENTLPVVRALLQSAVDLIDGLGNIAAIGWRPASALMGADYFSQIVTNWADGGPFPALGLVTFRPALDGIVNSVGLSYFTGQELRIEGELGADRAAATRLAVRLVNELVAAAPITERIPFIGPDKEKLLMEPSANERFVRVWKG